MNITKEYAHGFNVPFLLGFSLTDATEVSFSMVRSDGSQVTRVLDSSLWQAIEADGTLNVPVIDGDITTWGYYRAELLVKKAGIEIPSDTALILVKPRAADYGE